jgi:uncharacterized protein YndB with AHSA1/START domain
MNTADTVVRINRIIPGAQVDVFAAWTDPRLFGTWFAPAIYHVEELDIDVRVGGTHRTTVVGPDGDRHTTTGVYTDFDPPRLLGMTWNYAGEHPDAQFEESHVRVEFVPIDDRTTEIRLTHDHMLTDRARNNVGSGWQECLDKLEAMFTQ